MMKVTLVSDVDAKRGFLASLVISNDQLFAAGGTDNEATVLASSDGRHLYLCAAPNTSGLRALLAGRRGALWTAGKYGLLARSNDGGLSWAASSCGTNGCLYDLAYAANGELLVSGDAGFVAASREGKTWRRLPVKIPVAVQRIITVDRETFLLRADGKVTIWDGSKARTVTTPFKVALTDMVAAGDQLWLVGHQGACATSDDRGRTWKKKKLPITASWEAINVVEGSVLIVGSGGNALLGRDGKFVALKTGTPEHLWSICPVEGGAFVGGEGGLLLRVEDSKRPVWAKRKDTLATRPGPDDRYFKGDLDAFLTKRFAGFLGSSPPRVARSLADFAPVWGVKAPAGLLALTKAWHKAKREPHEWRYEDGGLPNPPKSKNLFELIITRDQKNYLGTGLFEAFGGLHFIGYQGNGDYYLIETLPKEAGAHQVIHFDHETFEFSPFADSANSLAVLSSAAASQSRSQLSVGTWKRIVSHLSRRVSPTWHFFDELGKAKLAYRGDRTVESRLWRSQWIIYLLRQDGVQTIEDIPELFDRRFNPALDDALYQEIRDRIGHPPVALWCLWSAFFFDDAVWLDRMIAVAAKSRSRLVRDAGTLVAELREGRKKLGTIANIHTLRKQFLELDLGAGREKERAKEKKVAAKKAAQDKKSSIATIKEAVSSGEDLVDLAFRTVADRPSQEELWKVARALPFMADPLRRLDWLAADSWHREGRILDHEEEEVIEIFLDKLTPEVERLLVALWVGQAVTDAEGWHRSLRLLRDLARLRPIDRRVADALRPLIRVPSRYEHKRQRVLWVLGAMRDTESVQTILSLVEAAKPTMGPYYLDFGDSEGLVKAALWALAEIGDRAAGPPILAKLRAWGKTANEMNVYMARALRTVGDESAVDLLLELSRLLHKENNHDQGVTEMLWTAAVLGANATEKKRKAWVRALPPVSEYRTNINIARDIALRAFTKTTPPSLEATTTRLLTEPRMSSSWERNHVELALRAVHETELPTTHVVPLARSEDLVFRRLSRQILASRGQPAPEVIATDLFELEGLSDQELEGMLRDERRLFRSRVVDQIAKDKRVALRPAVIARARTLLAELPGEQRDLSTEQEYALFWAVKGLLALGLDEPSRALFVELLRHPNRNVKDPVLRFAPHDRGLEEGMRHVLDENWAWQANAARAWLKKSVKR